MGGHKNGRQLSAPRDPNLLPCTGALDKFGEVLLGFGQSYRAQIENPNLVVKLTSLFFSSALAVNRFRTF